MYLSPTEISEGKQQTLVNLHLASLAVVDAGERLSGLFLKSGRSAVDLPQGQPVSQRWFAQTQANALTMLGELLEIIGDTQQTIIKVAERQTKVVDDLLLTTLERASRNSPFEGVVAINVARAAIGQAENTFIDFGKASMHAVDLIEEQTRQTAEAVARPLQ
jgi:hypothetical protein